MEVWRHISAGRLSELFGDATLEQDRFIRTLGWREAAERDLAAASARGALDRRCLRRGRQRVARREARQARAGVPGQRRPAASRGPRSTRSLGQGPGVQPGRQHGRGAVPVPGRRQLGDPGRTDELFPARECAPVIVPSPAADRNRRRGGRAGRHGRTPRNVVPALADDEAAAWRDVATLGGAALERPASRPGGGLVCDHGIGSNDWVVARCMSSTGGALLANDPHLGISMPSVWFINGLHCAPVSARLSVRRGRRQLPGRARRRCSGTTPASPGA